MKHLFIINPIAGGQKNSGKSEKAIREALETIEPKMPEEDEIILYVTSSPMDGAERVKREAIKGGTLRVYACGGDGTLNECAHAVAGFSNAAVTSFPCGTGNDFVKMFGEEKFSDLEDLMFGNVQPLDIIDVNGRKSLNISSVGIDARIGADVHKYSHLPLIGGSTGYVVSLIVNLLKGINRKMTIKTESGEESGKYALVCACNGRFYGGGFNPTKTAMPDDGIMEILIVKKVSIFQVAMCLSRYAKGEYYKLPELITHIRGKRIEITSDKPFIINTDGEILINKKVTMRLVHNGVNFILPRGLELSELRNQEIEEIESKKEISIV